jgi:hypothetical protein
MTILREYLLRNRPAGFCSKDTPAGGDTGLDMLHSCPARDMELTSLNSPPPLNTRRIGTLSKLLEFREGPLTGVECLGCMLSSPWSSCVFNGSRLRSAKYSLSN